MFAAGKTATPSGGGPDAQFNYVTMLLHGDGTNGAQNNTFVDSSTNNFTITRNGNTTQGSFSPYGSNWSNHFDGSGDYLRLPSAVNLSGDFTAEAFVYSDSTFSGQNQIFGSDLSTADGNKQFYIASSTYKLTIYDGSSAYASSGSVPQNQWSHVAISRQGSTITFYINGVSSGTATVSATMVFRIVGGLVTGSGVNEQFKGYISNARIVSGTSIYNGNFTPSTVPLTAVSGTQLLTCQSNRFIDNSTNNFTVTVAGNTSVQRFNPFGASTAYSTSVIGGSGYFDGSGDYLSTPNSSSFAFGTGNFTVEFWYRGTDTGGGFGLTTGGSTGYWQLNLSGSTMYWQNDVGVSNLLSVSATPILNDAWNHVAVVRNSTTLTIYFNGVSVTSTSDTTNYSGTGGDFQLGFDSNSNYITGYIADYRIVKGTAVYTANFTPPTAPLTAITNTSLLLSMTNGAIFDNAMMNDLETVGNAQISTSVKKYGTGSMYFDGNGDNLAIPTSPNLNMGTGDFTVECWVYISSRTLNYPLIFGNNNGGYSAGAIALTNSNSDSGSYNDKFVLSVYDIASPTLVASSTNSSNTWYHLAVVRNGTSLVMYRDGTSVASTTISSGAVFDWGKLGSRIGGGNWDGAQSYFNGYIDDLRITKGFARYTTTFTPPTSALSDTGPY